MLLQRLRDSRDEDAWRCFDERFRGVIIATGLRLGLSEADAHDAAQETILQALRDYQAGKYDRSRGRLSSWIIAIAHHRITDTLRKRRRHQGLTSVGEESAEPGESEVALAWDEALEHTIFQRAWDQLRAQSQAADSTLLAFELTALRQVPPAEAAGQCGMSVDQIYVARTRVAKKLQGIVAQLAAAYRDGL